EIMSDSRVGNFGAVAGFAILLLKVAALSTMSLSSAVSVLLLIPCWARWTESYAIGAFKYLRESGMGKIWHDTMVFPRDFLIGCMGPLVITGFSVMAIGTFGSIASCVCVISGMIAARR